MRYLRSVLIGLPTWFVIGILVGFCKEFAVHQGITEAVRFAPKADWLPEPCTVDYVNDECPEGKALVFSGFEEGLRWLLSQQGYLSPSPAGAE